MTDDPQEETLDQSQPDAVLLQLLGLVNHTWSMVDEALSAAIFSLLQIDKFEFTILLGKIEFPTKVGKLKTILAHRKDKPRLAFVEKMQACMDGMRADRNALTHGVYQGRSSRLELFFMVPSDVLFDKEKNETAYKLRLFTHQSIGTHIEETIDLVKGIMEHFDTAKMLELRSALLHIPPRLRIDPVA